MRWVRNKLRYIKWWFMRANGKIPPCDWWDFKYNMTDYIAQGLDKLLHDGMTDWESPAHKEQKRELERILEWMRKYQDFNRTFVAHDEEQYKTLLEIAKNSGEKDILIMTQKEYEEFEKEKYKVFRLLAKNLDGLWD